MLRLHHILFERGFFARDVLFHLDILFSRFLRHIFPWHVLSNIVFDLLLSDVLFCYILLGDIFIGSGFEIKVDNLVRLHLNKLTWLINASRSRADRCVGCLQFLLICLLGTDFALNGRFVGLLLPIALESSEPLLIRGEPHTSQKVGYDFDTVALLSQTQV